MGKQIGFSIDKQGNKRTILCLLGFRKVTKYIIKRIDGEEYFVCSRCGKRIFCLLPLRETIQDFDLNQQGQGEKVVVLCGGS